MAACSSCNGKGSYYVCTGGYYQAPSGCDGFGGKGGWVSEGHWVWCKRCNGTGKEPFCFLTTACTEARGLPDNCPELETLRGFRDSFVRRQPDGEELVRTYYSLAPLIVTAIDERPDAPVIYNGLWTNLVVPCVDLIRNVREAEAMGLYSWTFLQLRRDHGV